MSKESRRKIKKNYSKQERIKNLSNHVKTQVQKIETLEKNRTDLEKKLEKKDKRIISLESEVDQLEAKNKNQKDIIRSLKQLKN